ncbi:MAG: RNA polymerase sigma factor, partial [Ktedonobacterales bacterium]
MLQPRESIYAGRIPDSAGALEAALAAERLRLVALCARLTGSGEAAEDLAQETLYEAWRHLDRLHAPEGLAPWLSAIARNVCLRWRSQQASVAPRLPASEGVADAPGGLDELPDRGADIELELERAELAALLDRALALLPPSTRAVLVARYVEDSPHADIAARLGMSEGAVRMRLRRGKIELRRVLEVDMGEQARAYVPDAAVGQGESRSWEETRIWCPNCGQRHVLGRMRAETGEFELRCGTCNPESEGAGLVQTSQQRDVLGGVTAYKPAFSRIMAWGHAYNRRALATSTATCIRCGGSMRLRLRMPETLPERLRNQRGMSLRCETCGDVSYIAHSGLVLWTPEVRRFWKRYPRMRALPPHEVETEG